MASTFDTTHDTLLHVDTFDTTHVDTFDPKKNNTSC